MASISSHRRLAETAPLLLHHLRNWGQMNPGDIRTLTAIVHTVTGNQSIVIIQSASPHHNLRYDLEKSCTCSDKRTKSDAKSSRDGPHPSPFDPPSASSQSSLSSSPHAILVSASGTHWKAGICKRNPALGLILKHLDLCRSTTGVDSQKRTAFVVSHDGVSGIGGRAMGSSWDLALLWNAFL